MNLYGSRKVKNNLMRLAIVLLLALVVKSLSDDSISTSRKASLIRKSFAPIRPVIHKSKESSGSETDSADAGAEATGESASGSSKKGKGSDKEAAGSAEDASGGGADDASGGGAEEASGGSAKGGKKAAKEDAASAEGPAASSKSGSTKGAAATPDADASDDGAPSSSTSTKGGSTKADAAGPDADSSASSSAEGPSSSSTSTTTSTSKSTGKGLLPAGPITLPSGATVADVTESGAKGNGQPNMEGGECKNAIAFIQAWKKACQATGPAKVLIPAGDFVVGQVLFTGPCKSSPIMVENKGTLLANPDLGLYPSPEWILFEHVDNVIFTGSGVVNGNGPKNWEKSSCKHNTGKSSCSPLPTSIKFHRANNSIIDGVKSVDSMFFHMFLAVCSNVTIRGVTLTAPATSPNTDGIHTSKSSDVTIYDSTIGTGDDCISIGQGSVNINAFNVKCGPGHGISVGSLGKEDEEEDVKGIHIHNCTLKGTDNGARIKTWQGKVDTVADEILYEDLIMEDVKNPIIIDTNYMAKGATEPSHVKLTNIHFKNIKGTASNEALVTLNCSSAVPCSQVTLDTISLKGPGGKGLTSCQNAKVSMVGQSDGIACGK